MSYISKLVNNISSLIHDIQGPYLKLSNKSIQFWCKLKLASHTSQGSNTAPMILLTWYTVSVSLMPVTYNDTTTSDCISPRPIRSSSSINVLLITYSHSLGNLDSIFGRQRGAIIRSGEIQIGAFAQAYISVC